jgi:hypothetical protein
LTLRPLLHRSSNPLPEQIACGCRSTIALTAWPSTNAAHKRRAGLRALPPLLLSPLLACQYHRRRCCGKGTASFQEHPRRACSLVTALLTTTCDCGDIWTRRLGAACCRDAVRELRSATSQKPATSPAVSAKFALLYPEDSSHTH